MPSDSSAAHSGHHSDPLGLNSQDSCPACQFTAHPREGDLNLRLAGWKVSRHNHSPSWERQGSAKPSFILVLPFLLSPALLPP